MKKTPYTAKERKKRRAARAFIRKHLTYLHPSLREDPDAFDFVRYLLPRCRWNLKAFRHLGVRYAWSKPIPPRAEWWGALDRLDFDLRVLEKTYSLLLCFESVSEEAASKD